MRQQSLDCWTTLEPLPLLAIVPSHRRESRLLRIWLVPASLEDRHRIVEDEKVSKDRRDSLALKQESPL